MAQQMREIFRIIFSVRNIIHFCLALTLSIGVIWWVLGYMDSYTSHSMTIKVPNFIGMNIAEVKETISDYNLRYIVSDSIYDDNSEPGRILIQNPDPESEVKKNRTVYLTITPVFKKRVILPELTQMSLRQAQINLNIAGLKPGIIEWQEHEHRNIVLGQKLDGKPIEPGTEIPVGSEISLVVGTQSVFVPDLKGLTFVEAQKQLREMELISGDILACRSCLEPEDSLAAVVYSQTPRSTGANKLRKGEKISLYLRYSPPEIKIND